MVANLEFMSLLAVGDCHLAVSFLNKFILQVMGPPLFVAAVFLAWLLLKGKKGTPLQKARKGQAIQFCVVIIQLLYPKLSTFTL